ncbi:MAG: TRAP transporter small permease subunit [Myxococcales bacterium]|nr:TRAP transporter small permease subunit [Myxococcales bacterium]
MRDSIYKRLDHAVYRAERGLVVVSLVVMAVVVFLDVVHRSFSGEQSKFAAAVAKVAGWGGVEIVEGTASYQQLVDAAPTVLLVVFTGLTYFGIRSAKRATPVPPVMALAGAVGGVLVAYGLVRLLLVILPNGLIWSQNISLVLTLWVGFFGASMCSYENRHLRVEAVQRHLPDKWRPAVGFASGLLTTLVCLALLWLSLRYVRFNYQEFASTEGKGGLVPGTELPKYVGFAALPVAFAMMSIRFFAKALGALRGDFAEPPDLVAAAGGPTPSLDSHGRMPSEVATEALPVQRSSPDHGQESVIDTMNSESAMEVREGSAPRPQSKVPTQAHEVLPSVAGSFESLDEDDDDIALAVTRDVEEGPIPFLEDTGEIDPADLPDGGSGAEKDR